MVDEISKAYLATGEQKAHEIAGLPRDIGFHIICGKYKGSLVSSYSDADLLFGGLGAMRLIQRGDRISGTIVDAQGSKREVKVGSEGWGVVYDGREEYKLIEQKKGSLTLFFHGKYNDTYDYVDFEAGHGYDAAGRNTVVKGGFLLERNHDYELEKILFSPEDTFELFSQAYKDDTRLLEHYKDALTSQRRVVVNLNIEKV